jgi:hypothetical protein
VRIESGAEGLPEGPWTKEWCPPNLVRVTSPPRQTHTISMKRSVVVLPNKNKVAKEDIQEARALLARKCLWELLVAAKQQVDVATWCKEGGLEAEDLLDAIDSGRPHPLLRSWEERKATVAANRPRPSLRELHARHLAVLLCAALERAGLGKRQARQQVSRLLASQSGLFSQPPSDHALERWQRAGPALTPEDECVIANAMAKGGPREIKAYFVGLLHFALNPLAKIVLEAR